MARLAPILLGLTFVMSVVTMVLVLLLFITKPWDDGIIEAELSEILQAEKGTSSEEKEAERVAKCESVMHLVTVVDPSRGIEPLIATEMLKTIMENNCLSSP